MKTRFDMNARSLLLLVMTALAIPLAAAAQPLPFGSSEHDDEIGADLALSWLQIRDDLLTRIRHDGPGAHLRLWCELVGPENIHTIRLGGGASVVANRFGIEALSASTELAYGYGVKIPAWSDEKTTVYLGGMLSAATDVQFYETIDESHFYWLTAHDLRIHASIRRAVGESGRFIAEVGVPVVALIARPEEYRYYNNDMPRVGYILSKVHEGLKVETLDRFQAADLRVGYGYPLSEHLSQSVSYTMRFRRSTDPTLLVGISHALQLSLGYSL